MQRHVIADTNAHLATSFVSAEMSRFIPTDAGVIKEIGQKIKEIQKTGKPKNVNVCGQSPYYWLFQAEASYLLPEVTKAIRIFSVNFRDKDRKISDDFLVLLENSVAEAKTAVKTAKPVDIRQFQFRAKYLADTAAPLAGFLLEAMDFYTICKKRYHAMGASHLDAIAIQAISNLVRRNDRWLVGDVCMAPMSEYYIRNTSEMEHAKLLVEAFKKRIAGLRSGGGSLVTWGGTRQDVVRILAQRAKIKKVLTSHRKSIPLLSLLEADWREEKQAVQLKGKAATKKKARRK